MWHTDSWRKQPVALAKLNLKVATTVTLLKLPPQFPISSQDDGPRVAWLTGNSPSSWLPSTQTMFIFYQAVYWDYNIAYFRTTLIAQITSFSVFFNQRTGWFNHG